MSAQAYGPIFSRGLSHLCPKIFLTATEKTAMLTCKLTLPNLLVKIPDFGHFISLDGMNSVFTFNTKNSVHFGYWLLPEKFSFCPSLGAAAPSPLAHTPIYVSNFTYATSSTGIVNSIWPSNASGKCPSLPEVKS